MVEEGVSMYISLEEWEKDIVNIDFDERLVSEMREMYDPQSVTKTSSTSPPILEGRGKNTIYFKYSTERSRKCTEYGTHSSSTGLAMVCCSEVF